MNSSDDLSPISRSPRRDALTILRIMLLTGGVLVGMEVFGPKRDDNWKEWTAWRQLANAVVVGLSLPAPLFLASALWRRRPELRAGSVFAMAMGCGAILLLPPPLIAAYFGRESSAPVCLYYIMPQVGLWFLVAALLTRQINRELFAGPAPWTELYGYVLALLWSPLGIWHLVRYYRQAFLGVDFFE